MKIIRIETGPPEIGDYYDKKTREPFWQLYAV
jgi:hypothetical protein